MAHYALVTNNRTKLIGRHFDEHELHMIGSNLLSTGIIQKNDFLLPKEKIPAIIARLKSIIDYFLAIRTIGESDKMPSKEYKISYQENMITLNLRNRFDFENYSLIHLHNFLYNSKESIELICIDKPNSEWLQDLITKRYQ